MQRLLSALSTSKLRILGQALRSALSGGERDYTSGHLGWAVLILSVPMILEMLLQSVFELADIFFVSRLGAEAVAAVGIVASLLVIVFAIGVGLTMAVTAMVARRIGEKESRAASATAFQGIVVAVLISAPLAIGGIVFTEDLMRLMGASDAVVELGATYGVILFASTAFILLLMLINGVFRGAGDAAMAMRVLAFSNGLNVVLDPVLIFGIGPFPEMGIAGAAVATAVARAAGVAYQIHLLIAGTGRLRLNREAVQWTRAVIARIFRVAGPGMVQYVIGSASWLLIIRLVAGFGSVAVAGYTIGIRIIIFALLPCWGMANAAATLVGQNLGAGRPDRAERAVWITSAANAGFLAIVGALTLFFDNHLMGFFSSHEGVIVIGSKLLRYVAYTYPFLAVGTVMVQAFNGAGDTATPTWINLLCSWLFQLPLAYVLAHPAGWGVQGIVVAIASAEVMYAGVGVWWFRRGAWKLKVV